MTHTKFLFANTVSNGANETHVFNFPKLMSSINRQSYHNVDTKGNAQNYMIGMKLYGTNATGLTLVAPNTYYVRRAVKAWHDARMKMYRRAGISAKSLGYARNLRPYLNVNHENGSTVEIDTENATALGITPNFAGDEWTYSRAAVAVSPENTGSSSQVQFRDLVDSYSFTILDDSVPESTTTEDVDASSSGTDAHSFVSVGMVREWLGSFKKRHHDNIGANTTIDDDNALLGLLSDQGSQKKEVLELAEEGQQEGRPWDAAVDSTQFTAGVQGSWCRSTTGESSYAVVTAPCGLLQLSLQNDHTASETLYVEFEVLDISDM